MSSPVLLDGPMIRRLLEEVAGELGPSGPQHTVVVVGGSLLAWLGKRDSTVDVGSIHRLDAELRTAVATVAARHGLTPDWLHDAALPFAPRSLDLDACTTLLARGRLRVLSGPLREVFLMKLSRSAPADINDMCTIWPDIHREFTSATELVAAFHDAFPHEPEDPHLADFVVDLVESTGYPLPLR